MRKIIVIKKNRRENGRREDDFGSNPHSKGEFFSRSMLIFFDRVEAKIIIIVEINIISEAINIIINIFYIIDNKLYDWKSNVLFILYKIINFLINKLRHIKIIIQCQQSVNIMRRPQTQSDGLWKNDILNDVLNK